MATPIETSSGVTIADVKTDLTNATALLTQTGNLRKVGAGANAEYAAVVPGILTDIETMLTTAAANLATLNAALVAGE